ncbi:MAG: D-aminoacyl-tRNA deacylase [Bryobacteraceae bacterium]|jgi:D-tyrosyl-tRNA(Tyr) deacylase
MRLLIQRVSEAQVSVESSTIGSIRIGLLVFVGISREDSFADVDYAVQKMVGLRIFPDAAGKMNCTVQEAGGSLLLVSQFTLYGDCRKGKRPSFDRAAPPAEAQRLYDYFVEASRRSPVPVETGVFQAEMKVHLVNEGPVTIWIDTEDRGRR